MKDLAEMSTTPAKGGGVGQYPFGVSRDNTATALRHLADKFERREAVVDVVKLIGTAKLDDYIQHTLIVRFTARRDEPAPNAYKISPPPKGAWSKLSEEGVWMHGYDSTCSDHEVVAEWEDEAARRWWSSDAAFEYIKVSQADGSF